MYLQGKRSRSRCDGWQITEGFGPRLTTSGGGGRQTVEQKPGQGVDGRLKRNWHSEKSQRAVGFVQIVCCKAKVGDYPLSKFQTRKERFKNPVRGTRGRAKGSFVR